MPEAPKLANQVHLGGWSTRDAVPADIGNIRRLQREAARREFTDPYLESVLEADDRNLTVAYLGGALVGWGKTHYWPDRDGEAGAGHYLAGVTVAPKYRQRGIGRDLTAARLDWIWARADEAWYVADKSNVGSIRLHEFFGFRLVARGSHFHTSTFDYRGGVLFHLTRVRVD
jgi:ribosomal protein S18 acetylase RimI-like enzyme